MKLLFAVASFALASAALAAENPLLGKWRLTRHPNSNQIDTIWFFQEHGITFVVDGNLQRQFLATYTVDNTVSPSRLTMKRYETLDDGRIILRPIIAIYRLDGDRLLILQGADGWFPPSFPDDLNAHRNVLIFDKIKPEEKAPQ